MKPQENGSFPLSPQYSLSLINLENVKEENKKQKMLKVHVTKSFCVFFLFLILVGLFTSKNKIQEAEAWSLENGRF